MSIVGSWDYSALKELIRGEQLPLMVVDLDILDANVGRLSRIAASRDTYVRTASKSVRVPELLRRIIAVGRPHLRGVMCFAAAEARLLAAQGFDDLLIAYPVVQRADLETTWELTRQGRAITLMVDEVSHIEILTAFCQAQSGSEKSRPLRVCIDADMSWRPLGLHVGTQRSPIRDLPAFERLLDAVLERPELQLVGVMAYEAQIAGIGECNPFTPLRNPVTRFMKRRSTVDVAAKRKAIADLLRARNVRLEFFNGGGTGSIRTTTKEEWVTEVTVGSGFLQSHLFDYYADTENQPACCFALQVTRCPQPDHITCQSGGFIASGPPDRDKAPVPFLPPDLRPCRDEGFGEVQTPLIVPPSLRGKLQPGDPIFFRPAKAGEIAERFNEYLLKQGNRIVGRAKTYRGLGHCFF